MMAASGENLLALDLLAPQDTYTACDAPKVTGGEGGIRTPDTVTRMPHFECGAFNRSATSPQGARERCLAPRASAES
jgi:hypothetical protein